MCGLWMLFANAKYVEQKMHQTELFKEKIPNGTFQHIRLKFTSKKKMPQPHSDQQSEKVILINKLD